MKHRMTGFNNPPDFVRAKDKWTHANPQQRGAIAASAGLVGYVCGDDWFQLGNNSKLRIANVVDRMCKLCMLGDGDLFRFTDSEFVWEARGGGWFAGGCGDGGPWHTDRETIVIPAKNAKVNGDASVVPAHVN